ncbi:class I SAM-dependent methyltransferase [Pseudoxanthobacter sp. M-2]|uniref:class I SAM-dependent methyltransferase n=1 Tax=Pseudoxanthobacter sp. M-2 TaxID=3078754 RepID=UPI0038FC02FA
MTVQAVQRPATALGGIAETACAPLVARALAADVAPDLGFRDRAAETIYRSMQPELEPHRAAKPAMLAMIATTWVIDQIVGSFTSRHPHAQIVDLGAGLSTRFQRIDNGMLTWIDVDLPEIVSLRETLFPFCDRRHLIGADIGRPGWIDRLELRRAPTLVVAEGLFAYAPAETMTTVLSDLAAVTGPQTELLYDYTSPLIAKRLSPRPTSADTPMRRGIRRQRELTREGWQLMRIHAVYEAMGLPYSAIGPVLRRLTRLCPHGVAHLVCTAAPVVEREAEAATAPVPPAPPAREAVETRAAPRPAAATRPPAAPPPPARQQLPK